MTLDNFTPIQKLIFVDAFMTIICNSYYQEEKDFDNEGRVSERRFVYPDGTLKVCEAYDYKRSRVTKFFFEDKEELLRLTVPLYTDDEQHTMFTPLKERVQQLGFSLENIERLSLSQQCNDPKNLTEQKVLIDLQIIENPLILKTLLMTRKEGLFGEKNTILITQKKVKGVMYLNVMEKK